MLTVSFTSTAGAVDSTPTQRPTRRSIPHGPPSLNSLYEDRDSSDEQVTTTATARRRCRRAGVAVMLAGVLAMLVLVGSSCTRNAYAFDSAAQVNATGRARGCPSWPSTTPWSPRPRRGPSGWHPQGKISHSQLTDAAGNNWSVLAENVGMASSISQMHSLFANSPSHRANIVNGSFDRIGTGVAESGGRLFVVQVFAG